MPRPTLPTDGATSWGPTMASAINAVSDTADAALASHAAAPAVQRRLSEFTGSTDDLKLAAFMSYAAAQTYKGITCLLDENRIYTFSTQVTAYSGFGISGPGRPTDQARSSLPIPNVVKLRMGSPKGWIALPNGTTFGVYIGGISFDGDANSRVFEPNASAVLWTSTLRDLGFQNGLSVIGSAAIPQPVDLLSIDGVWNLNNVQDVGISVAGSDCFLKPTSMNLDSTPTLLAASKYLAILSSLSKSVVSGFYVTCEQHTGFNITGTNKMLIIKDSFFEGRNASTPCYGAVVRIASDTVMQNCWIAYGMSGGTNGRTDKGMVHITAGNVTLSGLFYERATGVAESVPFVYVGGGKVTIRNITGSGTWTGKPIVQVSTAGGGTVDADSSVTVQTVA